MQLSIMHMNILVILEGNFEFTRFTSFAWCFYQKMTFSCKFYTRLRKYKPHNCRFFYSFLCCIGWLSLHWLTDVIVRWLALSIWTWTVHLKVLLVLGRLKLRRWSTIHSSSYYCNLLAKIFRGIESMKLWNKDVILCHVQQCLYIWLISTKDEKIKVSLEEITPHMKEKLISYLLIKKVLNFRKSFWSNYSQTLSNKIQISK